MHPGDYVALRVENTGTGMPPEVPKRALEPFFRPSPRTRAPSLG